ncbi:2-methylisocitrate lyase-like PEP mutase family enzyme [Herbaspirillum sp. Sphag1AN]|uniref:isocitrate lyase/PEP mutase family protein n=1 Tax=unclassified Herbaspirillum TaxID=2624150 RepID=UPI00161AD84B|nr:MULTISPECIES: isocitrate lyase/PEP mutase family protein [unclassified Herbaspirillum]MBB3213362.1 2-methylisocitrate lyase-like PEP mutase family enzyme [Herbaspirillum sp. Sphag1AN]MBB3246594.1 2-methylisocitrate lyase-like PEP mutase family enzyme [Herbaspirillum sp. Sphag64]
MSTASRTTKQILRDKVNARRGLLVPGAFNALSARVIADLGFEALYITGAGVTNMYFGMPDQGFIGLNELADHTARIRDAVDIPLIVDADTGFGNALNVRHTIRSLERAGADAVQLEDQVSPKRCGHFNGKEVISCAEMVGKIHAAVDARSNDGMLIMARTDARSVHGFEDALERAARYSEAGADILFVEATETADEIRRLPQALDKPQLVNLVIGGKTPIFSADELGDLGYGIVLYANAALQGAVAGMQKALTVLRDSHRLDEDPQLVTPFAERQRLVNKPFFDQLEKKYADK